MLHPENWIRITPQLRALIAEAIQHVGSKRYLGRRLGCLGAHPEQTVNSLLHSQRHMHVHQYERLLQILGYPEKWGLE